MSVYAGPTQDWYNNTDNGRIYTSTNRIIQNGLVLNIDAGASSSYIGYGSSCINLNSGYNSIATLNNGVTYSNDGGGCFIFDGVDDSISIGGGLICTEATFICWIKRNGTQNQYDGLLFSRTQQAVTGMNIFTNNQVGYCWNDLSNTYGWSSGLIIPNLNWCMCAISVSALSAVAYLCQSSGITSSVNAVSHSSSNINSLRVAYDAFGGRFFNGKIAIIQMYVRAFSSTEIAHNFNATRGRFGV